MSRRLKDHFKLERQIGAPLSRHSMNQKRASLAIDGGRRVYGDSQTHVKRLRRLTKKMMKDALNIGQVELLLEKGFSGSKLTEEEQECLNRIITEHEEYVEVFDAHGARITVTEVDLSKLKQPFEAFGEPSVFRRGKER